jgi:hypothetical protein
MNRLASVPAAALAALHCAAFLSGFAPCHAALPPATDAFGYSGVPVPYDLRDVSATGFNVGLDNSDDATAVVPIGFTFWFYGQPYTEVEISSNGFISFTPTGASGCCSGQSIPSPGGVDNFIAGYWEDLFPGGGGAVRTQTLGPVGAREFVVGYYNVPDLDFPAESINTFEIILYESSHAIELQYDQIQYDRVDNKVVGIENFNGTDGIQLLYVPASASLNNGDLLLSEEGYLITLVPEPAAAALVVLGIVGSIGRVRRRRPQRPSPPATRD